MLLVGTQRAPHPLDGSGGDGHRLARGRDGCRSATASCPPPCRRMRLNRLLSHRFRDSPRPPMSGSAAARSGSACRLVQGRHAFRRPGRRPSSSSTRSFTVDRDSPVLRVSSARLTARRRWTRVSTPDRLRRRTSSVLVPILTVPPLTVARVTSYVRRQNKSTWSSSGARHVRPRVHHCGGRRYRPQAVRQVLVRSVDHRLARQRSVRRAPPGPLWTSSRPSSGWPSSARTA